MGRKCVSSWYDTFAIAKKKGGMKRPPSTLRHYRDSEPTQRETDSRQTDRR
ncbi:expressed unknown protein [Ectocarpus siliculosus]|uniref:Uncharacterized protein n=1 Tax=Ectocarpus siliculosus TaxID=2880 RepID=D7G3M0_ECTSI|nr:expressed unknown protein [Ectocarpus siliculosus]|eukprot:CBJ33552.1 expressed unknown protein [Ectocarpus siliculosus]